MDELRMLGEEIVETNYKIAMEIHTNRMADVPMTEEQKRNFKKIEQQIIDIRANFIKLFGEALVYREDKQRYTESFINWGEENGKYFFNLNAPLDEALKEISYYREYILKTIRDTALANDMSVSTVFDAIYVIDPLMDKAFYYFSLTYVKHFNKSLERAKTSFLELSVPVLPLTEEMGVLPLIGDIDTQRAKLIMEKTLNEATKLQLDCLILDLSGVPIVDTMVANQLLQLVESLRIVGVKTTLTGIRPEVAQTIVTLGINFDHLTIKSNLHQVFKDVQHLIKY